MRNPVEAVYRNARRKGHHVRLSESLDTTAAGFDADGSPGLAAQLRRLAFTHRTAAAYQGRPELDPEQDTGDTINQTGPAGVAYWRGEFARGPVAVARRCVATYGPALTVSERIIARAIVGGAPVPHDYGATACRYAAALVHVAICEGTA